MIPTAAARAMLGGGARGSHGLVPVGRDVPIGLNIERFLGPANPFGQDPFKKGKEAAMDDAQRIALLVGPSEAMGRVLAARLSHLRVVGALWTSPSGPTKAIQHALDMDDDAVLVDLLNGAQPKLHTLVGVDLAQDLLPAVERLINSEYEDCEYTLHAACPRDMPPVPTTTLARNSSAHSACGLPRVRLCADLLAGLAAAASILKAVGHVMRDTAEAARQQGYFRGGQVSLQFEERVERCDLLPCSRPSRLQPLPPLLSAEWCMLSNVGAGVTPSPSSW